MNGCAIEPPFYNDFVLVVREVDRFTVMITPSISKITPASSFCLDDDNKISTVFFKYS